MHHSKIWLIAAVLGFTGVSGGVFAQPSADKTGTPAVSAGESTPEDTAPAKTETEAGASATPAATSVTASAAAQPANPAETSPSQNAVLENATATPAPGVTTPGATAPGATTRGATTPATELSSDWLGTLYHQVATSVVRIRTDEGTGTGFFFHSPRHIATALHVVDNADFIIVETALGEKVEARVVAYDEAFDVALLEMDAQVAPERVLEPFQGRMAVGNRVAVIGHPYSDLSNYVPQLRGLLKWSLSQGVVGAVSRSWLQTDAAINPGNSGGPVFAPDGTVIGVVSAKLREAQGIGLIVRIQRVQDLVPRIGTQPAPKHLVTWDALELGFLVHWAEEPLTGFSVGGGVRLAKTIPVRLRTGFVSGEVPPPSSQVLRRDVDRFPIELEVGYPIVRWQYLELVATGGVAAVIDNVNDLSLDVSATTACGMAVCPLQGAARTTSTDSFSMLPMLGATAQFTLLRVVYAYQIDVDVPSNSQHRGVFAFSF